MTPNPWYREPWPWIIMSGPAIVVVAGIVTTVLAVTSFDGMVADDYYKQGLGINRVLAREAAAARLGLEGSLAFSPERTRVRAALPEGTRPASLHLALVHPTLAGEDQSVALRRVAPGVYEGTLRAPRASAFRLRLEDAEGRWRLSGSWKTKDDAARLTP